MLSFLLEIKHKPQATNKAPQTPSELVKNKVNNITKNDMEEINNNKSLFLLRNCFVLLKINPREIAKTIVKYHPNRFGETKG